MYELHIAKAETAARDAALRQPSAFLTGPTGTDRPRKVHAWRRRSPRPKAA